MFAGTLAERRWPLDTHALSSRAVSDFGRGQALARALRKQPPPQKYGDSQWTDSPAEGGGCLQDDRGTWALDLALFFVRLLQSTDRLSDTQKFYETKQYKKGLKSADSVLKKFPEHGACMILSFPLSLVDC